MPTNNPDVVHATPMNDWTLTGCPVKQPDGTIVRETVHLHRVERGQSHIGSLHWVEIVGYIPRTGQYVKVTVFDPVWELIKEGE